MSYSALPLLFGLIAPLTFWACKECQVISYVQTSGQAQSHGLAELDAKGLSFVDIPVTVESITRDDRGTLRRADDRS